MPEERDRLKQLTKVFQPDASPLPKEKRDDLVARVCFEAQRGRKAELNDSLAREDRAYILDALIKREEARAIALNVREFSASLNLAEWLIGKKNIAPRRL